MKYSHYDGILISLLLLQLSCLLFPFIIDLSLLSLVSLWFINVFLMGTNYQCVAHNFIHLPFFKRSSLNKLFSIINTLGLGVPQSIYRLHHLNHHRYNNRPDGDMSSTYRFGKNGKEENIITYSLLGVIRTDLLGLYKQASRESKLPLVETCMLFSFFAILALLNWKLFLIYIVPSYVAGQVFAVWENYCEHHHATPEDRKRDSVSCYNSLYNFLWFNNGYHQEHHFSPQTHWRDVPRIKNELPSDRRIVKGCHLFNSL